jgi:hypothetical protein
MGDLLQKQDKAAQLAQMDRPMQAAQVDRRSGQSYEDGKGELSPEAKKQKEEERAKANQASYEDALGKWLGGELYDLVADHLSADKVLKYGEQGADALVDLLGDQLEAIAEKGDAGQKEAITKLQPILEKYAEEAADKFLAGRHGQAFAEWTSQFAASHPKTMVTMAVLAAIGAVAANVELPEIEQKFKLGNGFGLEAGVGLGKIQEIALQSVNAALTFKKGGFNAEVRGGYEKGEDDEADKYTAGLTLAASGGGKDGAPAYKGELTGDAELMADGNTVIRAGASGELGRATAKLGRAWTQRNGETTTSTDVSLKIGGQDRSLSAQGKFLDDGSMIIETSGALSASGYDLTGSAKHTDGPGGNSLTTGALGLGFGSEANRHQIDARYARSGDTSSAQLGLSNTRQVGNTTYGRTPQFNPDAAADDRLLMKESIAHKDGPASGNLWATHGADGRTGSGGLGVAYDIGTFKTALDAEFGDTNKLSASMSGRLREKFVYDGSASLDLDNDRITNASLMFGYDDPKAFEAFILEYRHNLTDDVTTDQFKLRVEHTIDKLKLRGTGQVDLQDGRFSTGRAGLMGMYPINEDIGIIGGAAHNFGPDATSGTELQLGVQVKKVPVYLNYDVENKTVGFGITIAF